MIEEKHDEVESKLMSLLNKDKDYKIIKKKLIEFKQLKLENEEINKSIKDYKENVKVLMKEKDKLLNDNKALLLERDNLTKKIKQLKQDIQCNNNIEFLEAQLNQVKKFNIKLCEELAVAKKTLQNELTHIEQERLNKQKQHDKELTQTKEYIAKLEEKLCNNPSVKQDIVNLYKYLKELTDNLVHDESLNVKLENPLVIPERNKVNNYACETIERMQFSLNHLEQELHELHKKKDASEEKIKYKTNMDLLQESLSDDSTKRSISKFNKIPKLKTNKAINFHTERMKEEVKAIHLKLDDISLESNDTLMLSTLRTPLSNDCHMMRVKGKKNSMDFDKKAFGSLVSTNEKLLRVKLQDEKSEDTNIEDEENHTIIKESVKPQDYGNLKNCLV